MLIAEMLTIFLQVNVRQLTIISEPGNCVTYKLIKLQRCVLGQNVQDQGRGQNLRGKGHNFLSS